MTLRLRTTLLATAVTGLVLIIASIALVLTLEAQLTKSGDGLNQARVRDLLDLAAASAVPELIENIDDESVAQVIAADGTVVASSPNIEGQPPILEPSSGAGDGLRVQTIAAPDDDEIEEYRVWVGQGPSPSGEVTVVVGRSLESVSEATRTLRQTLLVGVPLLLLLLAAVIWTVVGRALARLDRITSTVAAIDGTDLDRRVPETGVDDEVGRLAKTMNRMLARLQDSADRQRAFVADASHDLQSPLTGLRAQLEVAIARPDEVEVEPWAQQLLASSTEMELLVGDLLALAVAEGNGEPVRRTLLDLDEIVLEEATRARPATGLRIDTTAVSAAPVLGDATELRRLVRNLIDNAVRHARQQVRVSLTTGSDGVVLDVQDDGPGIPQQDRDRVFDRFYRGDEARGHGDGSGLGLAIALRIAERHGGRLSLVEGKPGAHFRLELSDPSARTPGPADA